MRLLLFLLSLLLAFLPHPLELLFLLHGLRFRSFNRGLLLPLLGLIGLLDHELHPLHQILIDLRLGHLLAPRALLHSLHHFRHHVLHL